MKRSQKGEKSTDKSRITKRTISEEHTHSSSSLSKERVNASSTKSWSTSPQQSDSYTATSRHVPIPTCSSNTTSSDEDRRYSNPSSSWNKPNRNFRDPAKPSHHDDIASNYALTRRFDQLSPMGKYAGYQTTHSRINHDKLPLSYHPLYHHDRFYHPSTQIWQDSGEPWHSRPSNDPQLLSSSDPWPHNYYDPSLRSLNSYPHYYSQWAGFRSQPMYYMNEYNGKRHGDNYFPDVSCERLHDKHPGSYCRPSSGSCKYGQISPITNKQYGVTAKQLLDKSRSQPTKEKIQSNHGHKVNTNHQESNARVQELGPCAESHTNGYSPTSAIDYSHSRKQDDDNNNSRVPCRNSDNKTSSNSSQIISHSGSCTITNEINIYVNNEQSQLHGQSPSVHVVAKNYTTGRGKDFPGDKTGRSDGQNIRKVCVSETQDCSKHYADEDATNAKQYPYPHDYGDRYGYGDASEYDHSYHCMNSATLPKKINTC